MPSSVAGNIIVEEWTVLDTASNPLTGMLVPTHVTLTLLRQSGATFIAASETIAWAEIGVTGRYYFSFTPASTGGYRLHLREIAAGSFKRQTRFDFDVVAAGSVFAPSYAKAFCAETDIERYIQTPINATTKPNDSEAAGFAVSRAAKLQTLCASLGKEVTPSTVEAESRLEHLLREANAIGAALDFTIAQVFGQQPADTKRIGTLAEMWVEHFGGPMPGFVTARVGLIEMEITSNLVSLTTSHILSGDTTARAPENAPQDVGLQVRMGDLY